MFEDLCWGVLMRLRFLNAAAALLLAVPGISFGLGWVRSSSSPR